jgi:formylglycine-generating enzyme required for sulfatase activity
VLALLSGSILVIGLSCNKGEIPTDSLITVDGGTFTARKTLVTISGFKIDKWEVTYELWTAVRNWGERHGYEVLVKGQGGQPPVYPNTPVTQVSWYDAVKWCNARSERDGLIPVYYTDSTLGSVYKTGEIDIESGAVKWSASGYRLPTEADWEYAARGGSRSKGYKYSGSNTLDSVAWYNVTSRGEIQPVGKKGANELGIYDMSGNAFEWCWDWMDDAYPSGGTRNPKGRLTAWRAHPLRLVRGGCFQGNEVNCQISNRVSFSPADRKDILGFRCIRN